jgi:propanol-preferring alcohol dehydrogenase
MNAFVRTGRNPAAPVVTRPGDTLIAVRLAPELLWRSLGQGATFVITARRSAQEAAGHHAHCSVPLTVSRTAFERAFDSLRLGGRVICVARPVIPSRRTPVFELLVTGLSIIGPIPPRCHHLAEIFELRAAGRGRLIT